MNNLQTDFLKALALTKQLLYTYPEPFLLFRRGKAPLFTKKTRLLHTDIQKHSQTLEPLPIKNIQQVSKPDPIHVQNNDGKIEVEKTLIKNSIGRLFPTFVLHPEPLADEMAKEKMYVWKRQKQSSHVAILLSHPNDLQILKNLAKAIEKQLWPVKLIDAEQLIKTARWKTFTEGRWKCILVAEELIHRIPQLRGHFRQDPVSQKPFLDKIPLLFLQTPLLNYEKQPQLKKLLWAELCQMIKSLL